MNCTIVLGVDWQYIEQLKLSVRTWHRFRPWMFANPCVMFFDGADSERGTASELRREAEHLLDRYWSKTTLLNWNPQFEESQRGKMLAGFVHAADYVATRWWMKIDCDSIATDARPGWDAKWFEMNEHGLRPAIVAQSVGIHETRSPDARFGRLGGRCSAVGANGEAGHSVGRAKPAARASADLFVGVVVRYRVEPAGVERRS